MLIIEFKFRWDTHGYESKALQPVYALMEAPKEEVLEISEDSAEQLQIHYVTGGRKKKLHHPLLKKKIKFVEKIVRNLKAQKIVMQSL